MNALVSQYDSIGERYLLGFINEKKGVYSVTTGHQLCFMGGPQFFIHKIISTIKSCQLLKEKHPQNDFIPIFWMATKIMTFKKLVILPYLEKNFT